MELKTGRPADVSTRLPKEQRVYDFLDNLGLSYQRIDHEAAGRRRKKTMAKELQTLRKEAGFRSARDFASTCGFSPSTYTRYENDRNTIPVKSAWKMADVLGCNIDTIVGRDDQATMDARGDIQKRYDALPPELQESMDEYLEFLEAKKVSAEERARQERDAHYRHVMRHLLEAFLQDLDSEGVDTLLLGAADDFRARFERFATAKLEGSALEGESREEAIRAIMQAYDAFSTASSANWSYAFMHIG